MSPISFSFSSIFIFAILLINLQNDIAESSEKYQKPRVV